MGRGRAVSSRKSLAASLADSKRHRWPWSELPPNTHIPPSNETQLWFKNCHNAPAITKSRLPTTTRCNNAYQRPQLVHVITEKDNNPTAASDHDRPSQFLDDSAIDVPTMNESKNELYWCVLRVDSTPQTTHADPPPLAIPYHRFENLEPQMTLMGLGGPNTPTSGLVVNYTVYGKTGRYSYLSKYVAIRHECAAVDPFDSNKKSIKFTPSIIRSQGKFFAISLQGTLIIMQASNNRLKITGMSAIRAIPRSNWRFFKEYLIEMNGEILLVFLIYEKSVAVVDHVEVFRLDLVKLGWIKVERFGGKTLFLKGTCVWVDSAEFGCMDDCVYFTQGSDDFWRVFHLKSSCF